MRIENLQTCNYCEYSTFGWLWYEPYKTCYQKENPNLGAQFSTKTIIQWCSDFCLRDVWKDVSYLLGDATLPIPIAVYRELPLNHRLRLLPKNTVLSPESMWAVDTGRPTFQSTEELVDNVSGMTRKALEFMYTKDQLDKWLRANKYAFDKTGNLIGKSL